MTQPTAIFSPSFPYFCSQRHGTSPATLSCETSSCLHLPTTSATSGPCAPTTDASLLRRVPPTTSASASSVATIALTNSAAHATGFYRNGTVLASPAPSLSLAVDETDCAGIPPPASPALSSSARPCDVSIPPGSFGPTCVSRSALRSPSYASLCDASRSDSDSATTPAIASPSASATTLVFTSSPATTAYAPTASPAATFTASPHAVSEGVREA